MAVDAGSESGMTSPNIARDGLRGRKGEKRHCM